jgi:hypothetical protein
MAKAKKAKDERKKHHVLGETRTVGVLSFRLEAPIYSRLSTFHVALSTLPLRP